LYLNEKSFFGLSTKGKFEHGFLSGFSCAEQFMLNFVSDDSNNIFGKYTTAKTSRSISSLGGTAMMKYGANMDIGIKVALSAAIGGIVIFQDFPKKTVLLFFERSKSEHLIFV